MQQDLIERVAAAWWYYTAELSPGRFAKGQYPDEMPMLPRILMRNADLSGAECLDLGSMEGLMPVLMRRGGARRVLATDAVPHCADKMAAIRQAYQVDFDFAQVGLMYDLGRRLQQFGAYDLINVSGLLYHVFSPMHVLAGVRPLLKKNGLMIVSQNVVRRDGFTMEYNARGRLQQEFNTFWYHSPPALEHMIRLFNLVPIDCVYHPRDDNLGIDTGYLSVMCRAVEEEVASSFDRFIHMTHRVSWEYKALCDVAQMNAQPSSEIGYRGELRDDAGLDLLSACYDRRRIVARASRPADAHILSLADRS